MLKESGREEDKMTVRRQKRGNEELRNRERQNKRIEKRRKRERERSQERKY